MFAPAVDGQGGLGCALRIDPTVALLSQEDQQDNEANHWQQHDQLPPATPLGVVKSSAGGCMDGSSVASVKRALSLGLITDAAALTRRVKRTNHQYSERDARPLKSAYFAKQIFMDS